jgi:hypothetical protein
MMYQTLLESTLGENSLHSMGMHIIMPCVSCPEHEENGTNWY